MIMENFSKKGAWVNMAMCFVIAMVVFWLFKGAADPLLPPVAALFFPTIACMAKVIYDAHGDGGFSYRHMAYGVIGAVLGTLLCVLL